jgi:hypothetical protein
VDPPTAAARVDPARSSAVTLHWSAADALSGVKDVSVEVSQNGSGFRPWLSSSADQPSPGPKLGAARYLGQPGQSYQLRLAVRDAARNVASPVVVSGTVPASAPPPATANDQAVLGVLPELPPGSAARGGSQQEHPLSNGALVLGGDAAVQGLGGTRTVPISVPASTAAAVDLATISTGSIVLLSDGTAWNTDGTPGPRFALKNPVRLLAAGNGTLIGVQADGGLGLAGGAPFSQPVALASGISATDAALFAGSSAGLMLDSAGALHAFGGADAALAAAPSAWTLPAQPAGLLLGGTPQAPAGILSDASGDWQTFGSLVMLPDSAFGRPVFDPATGLPIR